jgi:hypothetical protein
LQPRQVVLLCKEEVEQYQLATGNNGRTHSSCSIVRPGFLLLFCFMVLPQLSVFCFLFQVRWLTGPF